MRRIALIVLLPLFLLLAGCKVAEIARTPVQVQEAETQVAKLEQALTDLREMIASYASQLAEARKWAEDSQSQAAIAVVAKLEQAKAIAEAKLPEVEKAVQVGRQTLEDIRKKGGGEVPLWVLALVMGAPFAAPLAAKVPVVGPILVPLLGKAADALWETYATKAQKGLDADTAAKAKALEYQLRVTNELIGAAGEKADPILERAKAEQKAAGVHAVLEPLVAAVEAKG